MQTPLQQAIEKLHEKKDMWGNNTKESRARRGVYVDAIVIIQSLLPEERKMVEDAYEKGYYNRKYHIQYIDSNYFDQTFNQQTPTP